MSNMFQVIPICFSNCQMISEGFIRGDVGRVGFCQEQIRATRLQLENLEKSQVTIWMRSLPCTSVTLNPFLHGKSNPCLNAWTSGWLGGSEPMTALYSISMASTSWALWSWPQSHATYSVRVRINYVRYYNNIPVGHDSLQNGFGMVLHPHLDPSQSSH